MEQNVSPTENMTKFMEKNKNHNVASRERLDANARPILTRFQLLTPGFTRFVFEDKSVYILSAKDMASAPKFKPQWFAGFDE